MVNDARAVERLLCRPPFGKETCRAVELENGCGVAVELFEPESEIEFSGGQVAASDEAEDGVLDFGGEFGEGVTGAGTGDGVELVESELVVDY
jgi:hypothetical protein